MIYELRLRKMIHNTRAGEYFLAPWRQMAVCRLYGEYIGMCRDAYFLQGILTIVANPMCFYMVLEGHGFNHGFWAVFLRFPYVLSWGRLLQGSL